MPDAFADEITGGHPSGFQVVSGDVDDARERLQIVLGHRNDSPLLERTDVFERAELADDGIGLPMGGDVGRRSELVGVAERQRDLTHYPG